MRAERYDGLLPPMFAATPRTVGHLVSPTNVAPRENPPGLSLLTLFVRVCQQPVDFTKMLFLLPVGKDFWMFLNQLRLLDFLLIKVFDQSVFTWRMGHFNHPLR